MMKKILAINIVFLLMAGCSSARGESNEIVSSVIERGSDYQNIEFSQSQILFPYGVKVTTEVVTLNLLVSTSQKNAPSRIEDIQNAISTITKLASQTDTISLGNISVNQVNSSYAREDDSISNIQNLDTSEVTIKLTTKIAQHDNDFIKTVSDFNTFLNSINLPNSITIKTISIETDLGDTEKYRSQIISQLYQELSQVKDEHGQIAKFGITGLYDPLKKIQLSDTEYYLYLEPVVTVIELQ